MTSQSNTELIPCFSEVLDRTPCAFHQVNHVTGPTVFGGFDSEFFTSCSAAKPAACSNIDAGLEAWLFALEVAPVGLLWSPNGRSYKKIP